MSNLPQWPQAAWKTPTALMCLYAIDNLSRRVKTAAIAQLDKGGAGRLSSDFEAAATANVRPRPGHLVRWVRRLPQDEQESVIDYLRSETQ